MAGAPSKTEPPPPQHHHYTPLPHDQNDNVLPSSSSHLPRRTTISVFVTLLLISASAYVFWPSDPSLKIVRLRLIRVQVHTRPRVAIDVSMLVRIKVRNGDVYSMDYEALEVGVGYRGKRLGEVRFQQGHVRAFGSSYVDAEVELSGVGLFSDVVLLLEDLAKGTVPFDTVTEVRGKLGILFFHFPLQARVSCEVLVNTVNQTIFRHSCYEEFGLLHAHYVEAAIAWYVKLFSTSFGMVNLGRIAAGTISPALYATIIPASSNFQVYDYVTELYIYQS